MAGRERIGKFLGPIGDLSIRLNQKKWPSVFGQGEAQQVQIGARLIVAEREGFEPSERVERSTVFETAPFDHSGISPLATHRMHVQLSARRAAYGTGLFFLQPPGKGSDARCRNST